MRIGKDGTDGRMDAHHFAATNPTTGLERRLSQARRRRHGPLAWLSLIWLSKRRRAYLDGMIAELEREIHARSKRKKSV